MTRIIHHLRNETPLIVLIALAAASVLIHELNRPPWLHRHPTNHGSGYSASTAPPKPLPVPVPSFFPQWRQRFLDSNVPADHLGLVRGIFLGDDSVIPDDVRLQFRVAGLYHLLAASGFNCWIVAFCFALIAKLALYLCFPFLPTTTGLIARKWVTPASQFLGAWLFWLWTDQSPPITRSAVMITGKLALDCLGLSASFGRALFAQYLISLTAVPHLWHNASFQLTFGCLFGILLFPTCIEPIRKRISVIDRHSWLRNLWDYAVVGTGACLGTIPTTWLVFSEINFTSLLTNWFAIPPVSFGIMPLGLAQILISISSNPAALDLAKHIGVLNAKLADVLYWVLTHYMAIVPSLRYYD